MLVVVLASGYAGTLLYFRAVPSLTCMLAAL